MADTQQAALAVIRERSGMLPTLWAKASEQENVQVLQMNLRHLLNMLEEARGDLRDLLEYITALEAANAEQARQIAAQQLSDDNTGISF